MTNPHEPVTPDPDGTLRFSDGSELKLTERDKPGIIERQMTLGDGTYVEGYTLGWENGYAQAGGEPDLKRLLDRYTEALDTERRKVERLQDTVRGFEIAEPKPPRIRTLELPGEINPDTHELAVNFAIILDRMGDTTVDDNQLDRLADETGARTAVSFPFEIQIGED